jgi:GT2 family glycosyltransferase
MLKVSQFGMESSIPFSFMNRCSSPLVSVVVATRNRGDSIIRTVRSILANDFDDFDITVIDQSDTPSTEISLKPYLLLPRLHYLPLKTTGLAAARNAGITKTKGELIAITDDDCEVSPDWLRKLVTAFRTDARIGIVFGNVLSGAHDSAAGFIPAYIRNKPFLARGLHEKHEVDGMGACMGVRRDVWRVLGGFDELLGVGAPLRANSEGDLTIRALQNGYFVYEQPAIQVIHHGFRSWPEGLLLIQRYWYGTGAMYAKHFKIAPLDTTPLLFSLAWRWAFGSSRVASSLGARTHKVLRLCSFTQGFTKGLATLVDRRANMYAPGKRRQYFSMGTGSE